MFQVTVIVKLFVVFAMCVLAASASVVEMIMDGNLTSNQDLGEKLYNSAVAQSLEHERQNKGSVIQNVVNNLIVDKRRNTMEYCYKLWVGKGQHIIRKYFPLSFQLSMTGDFVKLVYRNYKLALKLSCYYYLNNERIAYGDGKNKDQDVISWKFISLWEDNRVYFKIYNTKYNQYLKMSSKIDCNARDRIAKGSNTADSTSEQWFLQPAMCVLAANTSVVEMIMDGNLAPNQDLGEKLYNGFSGHF